MTEINDKEIIFRMSQSLKIEIKAREKGMTDVGPFAQRYNLLREKAIQLYGHDSEIFLPILSENLVKFGWTGPIDVRMRWFDEITLAISQLESYLEAIQKNSFKVLTGLEEFLFGTLRKNVHEAPEEEKEIQDIIEIMLNSKGYSFYREQAKIPYSTKGMIPDFTFEDLNAALEIKLCKTDKKEKEIIDEINADIPAYSTKYNNLTFLIYDLGIIRDSDLFARDIEKNNPRIKVLVVKH